jgi:hypothetical protein
MHKSLEGYPLFEVDNTGRQPCLCCIARGNWNGPYRHQYYCPHRRPLVDLREAERRERLGQFNDKIRDKS